MHFFIDLLRGREAIQKIANTGNSNFLRGSVCIYSGARSPERFLFPIRNVLQVNRVGALIGDALCAESCVEGFGLFGAY